MALWFDLRVNTATIGHVEIRRLSPVLPPPKVGDVCRYHWFVQTADGHWTGEVEHPYGNPWDLITTVLAELKAAQAPSEEELREMVRQLQEEAP